ncbi:hypothetical protein [Embleya sp. NBC_00896]|uniref:hypothetical protein n=1 Tax=Embleya sp. NBC_00896 TaxID=2975961 RepID=UPI00386A6065|nr:hypothetical protein OG928_19690 [Embleya sp. NBC_00896]
MTRPSRAPAGLVVLLVALCVGSAGCTAAGDREGAGAPASLTPPPIGPIPLLTSATDLALPIEAYLPTREQQTRLAAAERVLTRDCLVRLGFTYVPPGAADADPILKSRTERRYGVSDPVEAAGWGFRPPGVATGRPKPVEPPMSRELSVAMFGAAATDGVPPTAPAGSAGKPGPGCLGEARFALGEDLALDTEALASHIDVEAFEHSMADPRVSRVLALWSGCMRAKGYDYPDPLAAGGDPSWDTAQPTPREIAAATATVACKTEHNVVGTWFTVDAAYQRQAIERDAQALARVRANNETSARKAAEVVRG